MVPNTFLNIACVIQVGVAILLCLAGVGSVFLLKAERRITLDNNSFAANQLLFHATPNMTALRREANPHLQGANDQRALTDWFYRFPIERAERQHRANARIFFIAAGASGLSATFSLAARHGSSHPRAGDPSAA
jgi:hypothetical protein